MIGALIDLLRGAWRSVVTVLWPETAWRDLDDEVRFHLDMEADR
jgi:hypothetical protein